MKFTVELDDDLIRNVIGSAGIAYWAKMEDAEWDRRTITLILHDLHDRTPDKGDHGKYTIGSAGWAAALGLMAVAYPRAFADLVGKRGDMTTGDCLVQLACFGELRYG